MKKSLFQSSAKELLERQIHIAEENLAALRKKMLVGSAGLSVQEVKALKVEYINKAEEVAALRLKLSNC